MKVMTGREKKYLAVILAAAALAFLPEPKLQALAGWETDGEGNWSYREEDGSLLHGWVRDGGRWYYLDENGLMLSNELRHIDGISYRFFRDGRLAASTYVGLSYFNPDGLRDQAHDIRVIGKRSPENWEKDEITDSVSFVPACWMDRLTEKGWELMFYTDRDFLAAPDTDLGVYYVGHELDTAYRKLKFTDPSELTRGIGEFIGYELGLYRPGDERMAALRADQVAVETLFPIPDFYGEDDPFYFGVLCQLYWDSGTTEELQREAPGAWELLGELLGEKTGSGGISDEEETR